MSPATLLLLGALTAQASEPAGMTSQACIAATENFIALMKTDPEWLADAADRSAQMAAAHEGLRAMCDTPIEADDAAMLRCVAKASTSAGVKLCVVAAKEAQDKAPLKPIAAPAPMVMPATTAISQENCMRVQAHIFEVMRTNPEISANERRTLSGMREAFGPESDEKECKSPISSSKQELLRCQGSATTVPGLEACEVEALRQKTERLGPKLQRAMANTERLRGLLRAQQEAGEPLVGFTATPVTIPPDALAVDALPDGPGKRMLLKLEMSAVHCTYAAHTQQYNHHTEKNDGPPLPGGFALVTRCDLDGDGVAAHIGADAKNPTKLQTPPRIF